MASIKAAWKHWFSSNTWQSVSIVDRRLFIGIMVFHFILSGWFITRTYPTADESDYYGYGVRWAHGEPQRIYPIDDSKTPIVAPALIPIVVKPLVDLSNDPYGYKMLQLGRWMMYVYQLLAAFVLFLWMYRLWGTRQWLLPLVLYLFNPVVFSFGMIVGSDLACASLVLSTCYCLWRYVQTAEWRYWVWGCVFCALALVAKASMIYLPVLLMLLLLLQRFVGEPSAMQKIKAVQWMKSLGLLVLFCWVFVCAAYYSSRMFFPINELPAQSKAMVALKQNLSAISNWPVPLPYDYVSAFDLLKYHGDLGGAPHPHNTYAGISILGRYYQYGPVWYYYIAAFIIKLPIIILLMLGIAATIFLRSNKVAILKKYLFIWVPFLFFGILLSIANPFQIGIRHALMLFPFLHLFVGYGARFWKQRRPGFLKVALVVQLLFLLNYWPNMIAYTNELFWPKQLVYRYIHDSSIAYAQSTPYLQQFLKQNPDYQLAPTTPRAGKFAVLMEHYAASFNRHGYEWLYKNYEPVGHYMHGVLLFEISEASLRQKGLQQDSANTPK
ncbi:MAG TPA: glycosyltransferase family 39 protein [Phnomibacter sp.]|nr:glycosyltransferase family 39 protein [Phnomibacter sp.]